MAVASATMQAYDFPYLTFETSGATTSVAVEQLSIVVSGSDLVVTNTAGTQTFSLSELTKMYFSKTASGSTSGIDSAATDVEGEQILAVYDLSGRKVAGAIDSLQGLTKGIYVVKTSRGTRKISVR